MSLMAEDTLPARTLWGTIWRQFRQHHLAMFASVILLLIVGGVMGGSVLWTRNPAQTDILNTYAPLSLSHPFGTDHLGRDMLARMIAGGRISLLVGCFAMGIAMTLGTTIGALAGYVRALDNLLMRLTDLFLALPLLPLLLTITMIFRDPLRATFGIQTGLFILTVTVIGGLGWMPTARLVRAEVLRIQQREFVLAARSLGAADARLLLRHILPNVLSPVIVSATFSMANAMITESALSFLGLGFPPDVPTWGRLLFDSKDYLILTPNLVIFPGLALSLTVLCVNLMGDGLRDALDPRL